MKTASALFFALLIMLGGTAVKAESTHLRIDHREIVQLRFAPGFESIACSGFSAGAFRLRQPGGPSSPIEYQVPAGKELIITDIIYGAIPTPAPEWQDGVTLEVSLAAHSAAGSFLGTIILLPPMNTPTGETSSYQGTAVTLNGGLRVASRRYLCPSASQNFSSGNGSGSTASSVRRMEIVGYLVNKSI